MLPLRPQREHRYCSARLPHSSTAWAGETALETASECSRQHRKQPPRNRQGTRTCPKIHPPPNRWSFESSPRSHPPTPAAAKKRKQRSLQGEMAEKERGVGGSTLGAVQGVAMVVVAPLGLVFMEVAGEDVDEGRSPAAASGAWF